MKKIVQTGFSIAAGIYILQAGYSIIVSEDDGIYLTYLQTGLLFSILGYLENLRYRSEQKPAEQKYNEIAGSRE